MTMTVKFATTLNEASEVVNAPAEMLRGIDEQMERKSDGALYYMDRIWVPLTGDVRTLIMDEAHKSRDGSRLSTYDGSSKVPMLKPENGNAPPIIKVVKGVKTIITPTTAKEKAQRRLELKARSTLLMGIPNEHQLKFNSLTPSNLSCSGTNGSGPIVGC
ncbi:hypothetical protein Tco_1193162 [Tanacetum coccineum]